MRPGGPAVLLVLALLGAVAAGCGLRTVPPKTYLLSSGVPAGAPAPAARSPVVGVGPVTVPAYLDRPSIVVRAGEDEVRLSPDHHWAEPVKDGMARVVAENLAVMVPTEAVVVFPWRSPWTVRYRVTVEVLRFDGPLGGPVVLNARWRLLDGEGKELLLKAVVLSESATGTTHRALVAAQSRLLAEMSRDIASAIRARE